MTPMFPALEATGFWSPEIKNEVHTAYVRLHENPELGNEEFTTKQYLVERLRAVGFDQFVSSERAPTAVIVLLDSGRPGPIHVKHR